MDGAVSAIDRSSTLASRFLTLEARAGVWPTVLDPFSALAVADPLYKEAIHPLSLKNRDLVDPSALRPRRYRGKGDRGVPKHCSPTKFLRLGDSG